MILYDDLQFLIGLYIIIYLFYFGFFVNRHRSLLKYDDPEYLAFEKQKLLTDGIHSEDIESRIQEMVKRKNRYNVYNIFFFLFYVISFFLFLRILTRTP